MSCTLLLPPLLLVVALASPSRASGQRPVTVSAVLREGTWAVISAGVGVGVGAAVIRALI